MADHFAEKHPATAMPDELSKAVALKYHEKELTLELLEKLPRSLKGPKSCLGSACPCKQ